MQKYQIWLLNLKQKLKKLERDSEYRVEVTSMKKGKLIIVSGFSGVGKGTVMEYLKNNYDQL